MKVYCVPYLNPLCEGSLYNYNRIKAFFLHSGWTMSHDYEEADIILLNSCVHLESQRKYSMKLCDEVVNETEGARERGAKVVIFGCLPGMIDQYRGVKNVECIRPKEMQRFNGMVDPPGQIENIDALTINKMGIQSCQTLYLSRLNTNMAYIQISEGCNNNCTYCIVPKCIGSLKSKPIKNIISDVKACHKEGLRTFTLQADDCGSYGVDLGVNIADLVDEIVALDQEISLNLMNMHPKYLLKHFDRLIPHFQNHRIKYMNVPLQSVSNRILKLMNRPYEVKEVLETVQKIKALDRSVWLTTHLMFGFPGETREEFEALKTVGAWFDEILYLLYSDCPQIPSTMLPSKLSREEGELRADSLRRHIKQNRIQGMVVMG